jgi:hypothetical protein
MPKGRMNDCSPRFIAVRVPLVSFSGDEDGRGDSESLSEAADLPYVEFAFAGEDFGYDSLASDLRQF